MTKQPDFADFATRTTISRRPRLVRGGRSMALVALVGAALSSTGCPPPRPPQVPAGVDPPLATAVQVILYDLNRQLGPAPDGSRVTVFDPLLDGRTGQQTGATVAVQKAVVGALGPAIRSIMLM